MIIIPVTESGREETETDMWIADKWQDFELIDCSKGEKLERWGRYYLVRPDPQAIWDTPRRNSHWNDRDALSPQRDWRRQLG